MSDYVNDRVKAGAEHLKSRGIKPAGYRLYLLLGRDIPYYRVLRAYQSLVNRGLITPPGDRPARNYFPAAGPPVDGTEERIVAHTERVERELNELIALGIEEPWMTNRGMEYDELADGKKRLPPARPEHPSRVLPLRERRSSSSKDRAEKG